MTVILSGMVVIIEGLQWWWELMGGDGDDSVVIGTFIVMERKMSVRQYPWSIILYTLQCQGLQKQRSYGEYQWKYNSQNFIRHCTYHCLLQQLFNEYWNNHFHSVRKSLRFTQLPSLIYSQNNKNGFLNGGGKQSVLRCSDPHRKEGNRGPPVRRGAGEDMVVALEPMLPGLDDDDVCFTTARTWPTCLLYSSLRQED